MIGWVFFRAETLTTAVAFLGSLAGRSPALPTAYTIWFSLTPEVWLALVAGAIGSTPWVPSLAEYVSRSRDSARAPGLAWVSTLTLAALLVASILSVAARTYNPFIYFRF
jgi:alginate O-acetyltransferase complex protein AlgI